jgi:hypothetical protein
MKRKGWGWHCLLDTSDGVVDLESLGDLLGSIRTNIIPTQPDSESEEMTRGRGQALLTLYK